MFQCIDSARDMLDTELTAMVGESYNRAYGVSNLSSLGIGMFLMPNHA